jgi:hypothetical protein
MQSIFLSYSFKNEHEPLLGAVRAIIDAIGFYIVDGKILNSNDVGSGVKDKLTSCYGVVCVLTKEAHQSGWVNAEFWQAVGANLKICLLCDETLQLNNAFQGRLKFPFSDDESLIAIEQLASTLGLWKQEAGIKARALLLPTDIGNEAIRMNALCEYRCIDDISLEESGWKTAKLVPYVAGVQAILHKVPPNHSVKVRLTFHEKIVNSVYTPQQITLQLN